jgi:hypothetical protein
MNIKEMQISSYIHSSKAFHLTGTKTKKVMIMALGYNRIQRKKELRKKNL